VVRSAFARGIDGSAQSGACGLIRFYWWVCTIWNMWFNSLQSEELY